MRSSMQAGDSLFVRPTPWMGIYTEEQSYKEDAGGRFTLGAASLAPLSEPHIKFAQGSRKEQRGHKINPTYLRTGTILCSGPRNIDSWPPSGSARNHIGGIGRGH